ncbi:MAG: YicC/YloC family endoribonuclease [Pseudomonadota bacterium]
MSIADTTETHLQSMTGFGAAEGSVGPVHWRWELRSVNGRSLDMKFRMPSGTEALEPDLRGTLRCLHRGTVNASLKLDREAVMEAFSIDEEGLSAAISAIEKVRARTSCADPRPEAILSMRGVLATPAPEISLTEDELTAISAGFSDALDALLIARKSEADRVAALLHARCQDIAARVRKLREKTSSTRDQMAERLRGQLGALLADHVSEERLAQEAAMLAIKADVTEELDRLDVHTNSFRALLEAGGAAGRRLEFLTQELMREASTLTAKLHSAALKNDGLDLKELVDSLREQVLNIA